MIRLFSVVVCVVGFASCADSSSPEEPYRLLTEKRFFIGSVFVPDSDKNWRHEVFVGNLSPDEDPAPVILGEDTALQRVLWSMRARYLANVSGVNDAIVEVVTQDGSVVHLTHDRDGYYYDAGDVLRVEHGNAYVVRVSYAGRSYRGATVVPEPVRMNSVNNGDTIAAEIDTTESSSQGIPIAYFSWHAVDGAVFYHVRAKKSDWNQVVNTAGFETFDACVYPGESGSHDFVSNFVEIRAIEENYARIFHAGEPFAANEDWFAWWDRLTPLYITERSNIEGGGGVCGVVGAMSRGTVAFVVDVQR